MKTFAICSNHECSPLAPMAGTILKREYFDDVTEYRCGHCKTTYGADALGTDICPRCRQEDETPEVMAIEMPNVWKDVLMGQVKAEEVCINCWNYHPELDGWCDEKQELMPPGGTREKFKVGEG